MDIHVQCPQCQWPFLVPDRFAGKRIKCTKCGGTIPVPGGQPAPATVQPGPAPGGAPFPQTPAAPLGGLPPFPQQAGVYPAANPVYPAAIPTVPAADPLTPGYPLASPSFPSAGPVIAASTPQPLPAQSLGTLGSVRSRRKKRENKWILPVVIGGGCVAVLVLVGMVVTSIARKVGSGSMAAPADPATIAVAPPSFGPPVPMASPQPTIRWSEVRLLGTGQPGQAGRIWVYLPQGAAPRSLPCVVIAPAGSCLMAGMELGSGDQAEHWPYVQAGFAVVAYELDGPLRDSDNPSVMEVRQAYQRFSAAGAGLVNAKNAIQYAKTQIPEVDPSRIYVAGHSSAATLALLIAEHEAVQGCIAFAPCTDVPKRQAEAARQLGRYLPGLKEFLVASSPNTHAAKLRCPLFLFHARDDSNVPFHETQQFADLVRRNGTDVTFAETSHGDHYDSMTRDGIPRAIQWLRAHGATPAATSTTAAASSTTPAAPSIAESPAPPSGTLPSTTPPSGTPPAHTLPSNTPAPIMPEGPTLPPTMPTMPSTPRMPPTTPMMPPMPPPTIPTMPTMPGMPKMPGMPSFPVGPGGANNANPFPQSPGLVAVVRFQILGFRGQGDQLAAVRQAIAGAAWADPNAVKIDNDRKEIVIGVRVMSVNTAAVRMALLRAGFRLGMTQVQPLAR